MTAAVRIPSVAGGAVAVDLEALVRSTAVHRTRTTGIPEDVLVSGVMREIDADIAQKDLEGILTELTRAFRAVEAALKGEQG